MSKVLYEKRDHIVTITINRPEAMNAVDDETADLLMKSWLRFRDDDDAYVAVLRGAGDSAFCSGADLKTLVPSATKERRGRHKWRHFVYNGPGYMGYTRGTDIFKPMIAAINGYCFAGGLELACFCDFRIASEKAEFGVLNRRWNVGLGDGGTQRLPRIIGLGRALELIITGKRIDAQEAHRIGLVNEVVTQEKLMTRTLEIARLICNYPQGSIRTDKQAVMMGLGRPLEEGLRNEAALFQTLIGSYDFEEGPKAFKEKRAPHFIQDD
jgi:enoyl-CoA hydratase